MTVPSALLAPLPIFLAVGEGPPLIVFPGLSRKPVKSRLPYFALARVTKRRVFVINRPSGLPRGLTMPNLAARHAQTISQHFQPPIDLLGISTGGVIALQLAIDHPELVNRLIIATAASWLGAEGREKLRRYGDMVTQGRNPAAIVSSVLSQPRWQWFMTHVFWIAHLLERNFDPSDLLATIDAEVGFDVTSQLNQIKSPCLLIAGGRDRAFPLDLVQATAATIPGCTLIVYPKAGHVGTMLDRRFGPDVAAFLSNGARR